MARKQPKGTTSYVMYDVVFDDDSRNSNCKVPAEVLQGLEGDGAVEAYFAEQQAKIAEMSGKQRPKIVSIVRSGKKKDKDTKKKGKK